MADMVVNEVQRLSMGTGTKQVQVRMSDTSMSFCASRLGRAAFSSEAKTRGHHHRLSEQSMDLLSVYHQHPDGFHKIYPGLQIQR
jgi:hypothetical protein